VERGKERQKNTNSTLLGTNDAAIPLPCKLHPKWLATTYETIQIVDIRSTMLFGQALLIGGSSYCGALDLVSIGLAEHALDPSSEVYDDSGGFTPYAYGYVPLNYR
jgi:hypothetical protein